MSPSLHCLTRPASVSSPADVKGARNLGKEPRRQGPGQRDRVLSGMCCASVCVCVCGAAVWSCSDFSVMFCKHNVSTICPSYVRSQKTYSFR